MKTERLDKLVSDRTDLSRAEARQAIRAGRVQVAGQPVYAPEEKTDPALGLRLDPVGHPGYALGLPVAVVFLTLVGLGAWAPRFWCRSFCPLGALLGFLGRFAPLRRHVNEECSSCGLCERTCKMGAIPAETPERTLTAECILCWNCVACPTRANYIGFRRAGNQVDRTLDTRKRAFLQAMGVGALTGCQTAGRARGPPACCSARRQRAPSGSHTLRRRSSGARIRCGASCVPAHGGCAVIEAGFGCVFTPVLVPPVGWCEKAVQPAASLSHRPEPFASRRTRIKLAATIHHDHAFLAVGDSIRSCNGLPEVCQYSAVRRERSRADRRGDHGPIHWLRHL